jgi:hypothetical protein
MYDGRVLFHGPRFQGIRAVDGVSAEGITGTLVGVRELRWDAEPWRTDPLAVDGALQLVLLWVRHVLGGASLPMAVGEFHLYRPGPVAGSVTCRVRGTHAQDARAVCDAVLLDADGAVLAELRGIEAVLRPAAPARAAPAQV